MSWPRFQFGISGIWWRSLNRSNAMFVGVHLTILYYHNALQTLKYVLSFKSPQMKLYTNNKEILRELQFLDKYIAWIFILQEQILIILYKQMKDTSLLYQILSCSSVSRYNIEHIYYLKNHFIIFLFGCNKKKLNYGVWLEWNYRVLKGRISYTECYIATILGPF